MNIEEVKTMEKEITSLPDEIRMVKQDINRVARETAYHQARCYYLICMIEGNSD